jgi:hypothetical protein
MLKISDNPPIRPLTVSSIAELTGDWWVAHTKSRSEKAFCWDLHERKIGYFLPMIEKLSFSGGRKRRGMVPLFTSYVFFCGDDTQRYTALTTNRLCQVIPVVNRQLFLEELLDVEKALDSGMALDLHPHAEIGKRCRVTAGPLEGIEGIVIQRNSVTRLVLQVSILGKGSSLEINPDLLEPAE